MNFVELGTGSLPIWMGFVTAGPVVVLLLPVFRIDLAKRLFEKAQQRISGRKEMALQ
jgi:hypothetical protein